MVKNALNPRARSVGVAFMCIVCVESRRLSFLLAMGFSAEHSVAFRKSSLHRRFLQLLAQPRQVLSVIFSVAVV